jgi:hypothetical protein
MACYISLVTHSDDRLNVSATVEAPWADVRFRIAGEPVEVRVETADAAALIRGLLQAAQQLCTQAGVSTALPGAGWARAALLLDDALVAIAHTGQTDG